MDFHKFLVLAEALEAPEDDHSYGMQSTTPVEQRRLAWRRRMCCLR
jgi:hypothetical protein